MKLNRIALLACVCVFLLGVGGAYALGGDTVVTACATATTPAHTIGDNGVPVATIPGDSATNCVTTTVAAQTVTGPTTTVTSTVTTTTPTVQVLFNGDFETGNLSQYDSTYVPTGAAAYAQTVVTAPGGHTGKAARFETKANDTGPLGTSAVWDQIQKNTGEQIGQESWWHWEIYLPADFTDSNSFWQNLVEWHQYATGGSCNCPHSPPLTIQEIKGRFIVRIVNDAVEANSINWTQYDLGPATRSAWTSLDFHAVWSDNPAVAVTEISVNGAKTTIIGHPNEFTGYYNYLELGWYHAVASTPATQVIYYDNVRRCSAACP